MKRYALSLLTGMSFVVFLVVCGEWTRSHYISDRVESARFDRDGNGIHRWILTFWAGEGSVACNFFVGAEDPPGDVADQVWGSLKAFPQGLHWQEVVPPRHPADVGLQINPLVPPKTRRTGRMTPFNHAGFYGAFSRISLASTETITSGHVAVPFWPLALLAGLAPARWAVKQWKQERAVLSGRCAGCGYDLRESPGVCPECGRDSVACPPPRPLFHALAAARAVRLAANISALFCAGFAVLYVFALASAPSMDPGASRHLFYLDSYIPAAPQRLSISTCILVTALLPVARAVVLLARRLRRAPVETPAEKPISPATGPAPARTL